jgi:hypothetical protein
MTYTTGNVHDSKEFDKLDNSSLRVLGLILKDLVGSSLIGRLTICYKYAAFTNIKGKQNIYQAYYLCHILKC